MFRYLKHTVLPYTKDGFTWYINPYSGSLVRSKRGYDVKNLCPDKVINALSYCYNPYLCSQPNTHYHQFSISANHFRELEVFGNKFLQIRSIFYLSLLYASFKKDIFTTTEEALHQISSLNNYKENLDRYCLQKSLLAIKTSESFREKGVLFIGCLLPSVLMHAWIIEDSSQPDINDRGWINYRPMLALYFC